MIVNNPNNYLQDLKFYQDLLSSMGLDSGNLVVSPVSSNFAFSAVSNTFFDVAANRSAVVGTYRSLFLGSLYLKSYCATFTAVGTVESILYTNGASWPIEYRDNVTAVDVSYGLDREFKYDSVLFSLLRLNITGTLTYAIKGIFTGVKISY